MNSLVAPSHHETKKITSNTSSIFHSILLLFCVIVLSIRLYTVFIGGGWEDRAQFFGEGELRPNLLDFIYNEIMVYYLTVRIVAFKRNYFIYILMILSSFVYFTRLPLVLLFFSIFVAKNISLKLKFTIGGLAVAISVLILYVRFGQDLFYGNNSSIFYLTYPLIGIGRLIDTKQEIDISAYQYITLFLKPVDAILFVVDYIGDYRGELSSGRYVGIDLSRFVYIQWLQGAYNAFGTILYPFVFIAGWTVGPLLFAFFIVFQYLQYKFATQNDDISRRYTYLLLITGILFSWSSPFAWLAPFFFTKVRHRL